MLFSSGVAAVSTALLSVLKPGDQLLMVDSAYDPTRSLCDGFLKRWGVETLYYDPLIGGVIDTLITNRTRAIFLESPGSLTFEVQDIPAIVAVARRHGVTTLIDNTWATPLYFSAMAHNVDISILACTKYIGGHSDAMAGSVTANAQHWAALRQTSQTLGQYMGPDDAWLILRGLRTLSVRLKQHQSSALTIANWLGEQPEVAKISGASGLFSFVLDGGDDAAVAAMIDGLAHFGLGYSWGGFESLALPVTPAKYRSVTRWEAPGPVVRLSIGLEDTDDLIADLRAGLNRFAAATG
jgi:cystathionine beta-lyase